MSPNVALGRPNFGLCAAGGGTADVARSDQAKPMYEYAAASAKTLQRRKRFQQLGAGAGKRAGDGECDFVAGAFRVGLHAHFPLEMRSRPRIWIGSTFGLEMTDARCQSHPEAPIPARSDQAIA